MKNINTNISFIGCVLIAISITTQFSYAADGAVASWATLHTNNGQTIKLVPYANVKFADFESQQIQFDKNDFNNLIGINFYGSIFKNARLQNIHFLRCSFRGTNLCGLDVKNVKFEMCDFTGAVIHANPIRRKINSKQYDAKTNLGQLLVSNLLQTSSYKKRNLAGVCITSISDKKEDSVDFSNCNLSFAALGEDLSGCVFDNALLHYTYLSNITPKQLCSTNSYKKGQLSYIAIKKADLSNISLANMNLTGCEFGNVDFKNADFNETVISQTDFKNAKNLNIDQIKSTWNYKNNRLKDVKLPTNIQKIIDNEKK